MYKEFLRVRNIFLGFAIAVVALAVLVFALSAPAIFNFDTTSKDHAVQQSVTVSRGHVTVKADTTSSAHSKEHSVSASHNSSSEGVNVSAAGSTHIEAPGIEVSTSNHAPFALLLALAGFMAAIFGTVLGTCLAAENCGHLEIAWTRPASRVAYALRLMSVDAGGILAMFAFTVGVSLALLYAEGWQKYLVVESDTWLFLARFIAYALAWFGLVAALTASVRTKAGAIAGFSWVIAFVLVLLASLNLPPVIHHVVAAINYLNPLLYGSYSTAESVRVYSATPAFSIIGLTALTILGVGAALAQWRRLEA